MRSTNPFRLSRKESVRPMVALLAVLVLAVLFAPAAERKSWAEYGGGPDNSHYFDSPQITKSNVNQLQIAWTYPTRDMTTYQMNPIVVDNTMYVMARNTSLVALDATTGKELWVHENLFGIARRGINYWESKDRKDRRLILQINNTLQELDAQTGKSIVVNFGNDGYVDLRQGLGRDPDTVYRISSSTAGKVFENLILIGSAPGEGYLGAPGDLRAYDVRTGKLAWQFHTVPHPGEFGYETWPKEAWRYIGGVNTWGELSVDEKRGIAYFPTGSASFDFYGGDRHGQNLFANCLIALDARTGKRLWHFQGVHHDLWDYDFTAAPQLITVMHDGTKVDAVAQASKQGFLYVFDRVSGKPLWPIEERPVSTKTDVPGEQVWPTQPFPTAPPPFARQKFTIDDINPYFLTPEERASWKEIIANTKNEGLFTPPAFKRLTVSMPGDRGGSIWGMTSSNPEKGLMYVASIDTPFLMKIEEQAATGPTATVSGNGSPGRTVYEQKCQGCHGPDRAGSRGIPSLKGIVSRISAAGVADAVHNGRGEMPSFGAISAADLNALIAYLTTADDAGLQGAEGGRGGRAGGIGAAPQSFGGPVVGSGGAPAAQEFIKRMPTAPREYGMAGGPPYPAGVDVPPQRYYTGFDAHREIISPPWSRLTAYDLNTGTIKWDIPLGEEPRAVAEGIRNTGIMHDQRAVLVTSTGLLFAATTDGYVRAYDADNGKILWVSQLPAASNAIPAMYEVRGKVYLVVVAAASRVSFGLPPTLKLIDGGSGGPRAYVTYTLPSKTR